MAHAKGEPQLRLVEELSVHPLADIFPMLGDDELDELAEDIKTNGLLHPIVRTIDGKTIVDGRNRYEACRRAEVAPRFDDRIRSDDEARALIVSANLKRRNLSKGQEAMLMAMMFPEPQPGKRTDLLGDLTGGFSKERLSLARTVLRVAPEDLALEVLDGTKSLDLAHAEAQARKATKATADEKMAKLRADGAPDLADAVTENRMELAAAMDALAVRKQKEEKLLYLKDAPDLAALVNEGRMSIDDALAAQHAREEKLRNERSGCTLLLANIIRLADVSDDDDPRTVAARLIEFLDPGMWPTSEGEPDAARFARAAAMLKECATLRSKQQKKEK